MICPPEIRTSVGTWLRTVAQLSPRQVLARPSFRIRRRLAPGMEQVGRIVAASLGPSFSLPASMGPPAMVLTPEQVGALGRGKLTLAGDVAPLPTRAPYHVESSNPLFVYMFHELAWLDAALQHPQIPAKLRNGLQQWLLAYLRTPHGCRSAFWDPYPMSARVLNLRNVAATGGLSTGTWRRVCAQAATALPLLLETHLSANHLLRNRAALVVAHAALGGKRWLRWSLDGYLAELGRQFQGDGMHYERTPGYHCLMVWDLLSVVDCLTERGRQTSAVKELFEIGSRALRALKAVTHPDGKLAAFGDSAPEDMVATQSLVHWAACLGVPVAEPSQRDAGHCGLQTLNDSGFARCTTPKMTVFLSYGPFGAPHQPGHAHCDLFTFELDWDGHRLLVDPGTHAYHDPHWRRMTRSAAFHATPTLDGREQAEVWSRFRCGWRPHVSQAQWCQAPGGFVFSGRAVAFGPGPGAVIQRTVWIELDKLRVRDSLQHPQRFRVALTCHPQVSATWSQSGMIHFTTPSSRSNPLGLVVRQGKAELVEGFVSHSFAARKSTQVVLLDSDNEPCLDWEIQPHPLRSP